MLSEFIVSLICCKRISNVMKWVCCVSVLLCLLNFIKFISNDVLYSMSLCLRRPFEIKLTNFKNKVINVFVDFCTAV